MKSLASMIRESKEEAYVIEYTEFGKRMYVGGRISKDSYGVSWTAMKTKDTGKHFESEADAEAFIRENSKRFKGTNPEVVPVTIDW